MVTNATTAWKQLYSYPTCCCRWLLVIVKSTAVLLSVDKVEIMEVAIDKTGLAVERRLIFVDKNRDMFMTQVRVYGTARKTVKLCQFQLYLFPYCLIL